MQNLVDMFRACVIDFKGIFDDHLPLIEYAYNKSYHSSIHMTPFEASYGCRCRSHGCWLKLGEGTFIGTNLVVYAMEKGKLIR